jgi:hypothetical protein
LDVDPLQTVQKVDGGIMKTSPVLSSVAAILLLTGAALGDTFLQGLAGPNGLQNEGNQGPSFRNDRFYGGADRAFIGEALDWSGVGQSSNGTWATMISPTYFVSAWHFRPAPGDTVTFYTGNGAAATPHTYTVGSFGYQTSAAGLGGTYSGSDLWLGQLTAPVDANIAKYPVEVLPSNAAYIGQTIWTYGYSHRVGKNNIDSISVLDGIYMPETTEVMYFGYNAIGGQGFDECYLEGGDSGGPAFAAVGGSLALLGTGFVNAADLQLSPTVYDGAPSGDAFVPHCVSDLNAHMTGGEQVMVVVPEPSTLLMLAASAATLVCCRRRRNKASILGCRNCSLPGFRKDSLAS